LELSAAEKSVGSGKRQEDGAVYQRAPGHLTKKVAGVFDIRHAQEYLWISDGVSKLSARISTRKAMSFNAG
jgi:hypothetical protein